MSHRFVGLVAQGVLAAAVLAGAGSVLADDYDWRLPPGFVPPAVPADNPMSETKVALGAMLFADTRLSVTGLHSCQSCHEPGRAFTDGFGQSNGATGQRLPLNAPTLLNAAYQPSFGWRDAAVRTLEQQMRGPMFNTHPVELGLAGREAEVESTLTADAPLAARFAAAFPGESRPVTLGNVIRAIAAFERTLVTGRSPFDRYVLGGEHDALSDLQKHGMRLFFSERAGCSRCHGGLHFAGAWVDRDHSNAEPAFAPNGTGESLRVPGLRNVTLTGPYMHDGRFATLQEVFWHYEAQAAMSGADARLRRAPLTTSEHAALREFLASLSDPALD